MNASLTLSRNIGQTAWYGYSPDLTDAQVISLYTTRYGKAPQEILRGRSVVLAGPVEQNSTPNALGRVLRPF